MCSKDFEKEVKEQHTSFAIVHYICYEINKSYLLNMELAKKCFYY